jgi:hypothetical protein
MALQLLLWRDLKMDNHEKVLLGQFRSLDASGV